MVGKTPYITQKSRDRFETIKTHCGCLPCLMMGYLNRHTSIEHVTERGYRIGRDSLQHEATIGLCAWHHYGTCEGNQSKPMMLSHFGPSLAHGRKPFEEHFGDEVHVLIPTQNFLLGQFAADPWPEYDLPGKIARRTRDKWIALNANTETSNAE